MQFATAAGGQIRQAYREGQEDQLAVLGLVLNAVVLWNTRYLDAAVALSSAVADPLRLALIFNLRHTVASRSGQSALR